ncbi:MAG: hypothetical protein E6997_17760 [Citrobacter sp.]|nr:hypothetical protein [Citrobacter sp.]
MALTILAANNAQTVLAAGINSTATTLTVNAGTGNLFPSPVSGSSFFKLTLVDAATGSLTEIVHVTARAGDTMTIERAKEGTVARSWSANDIVANMMTSGTLELFSQKNESLLIANNFSEIAAAGPSAVAAALLNLGIGSAAKLSAPTALSSANGWMRIPYLLGGVEKNIILQWGTFVNDATGDSTVLFPIPFPTAARQLVACGLSTGTGTWAGYNTLTNTGFKGNMWASSTVRQNGQSSYWAIGE